MERRVWFQLKYQDGNEISPVTSIMLKDTNIIDDFRKAVKEDNSAFLSSTGSWQLAVCANQDSLNQPLESWTSLTGLGTTHEDYIVAFLPTATAIQSQTRGRKRAHSAEDCSLATLWKYSEMKLAALPHSKNLATILRRKLPFKLELRNAEQLFDENGPALECTDLSVMIRYFMIQCDLPEDPSASVSMWQKFYDILLYIVDQLCNAKDDFKVSCLRNSTDKITGQSVRPEFVLHLQGLVLLRGEENSAFTDINISSKELSDKLLQWNPIFYGDLPYILGYVTSGAKLQIVKIDRNRHVETILNFYSIFTHTTDVIKTFYNLAFFLFEMARFAKRTGSIPLPLFRPDSNNKRTIELIDNAVVRMIEREDYSDEDDFTRLVRIYKDLRDLCN